MRKASRLFEIIQILRVARRPITAQTIAEALEVTVRSVYRDISALQTMRVPIEGERGVGYILRPGFNLPPLMFSIEETEAIVLALAMVARTGDTELRQAAKKVSDKIAASLPEPLSKTLSANALHAWGSIAPSPAGVDLAMVRRAVRDEERLDITYGDETGAETRRQIRPIAMIYYSETTNIVAWCEPQASDPQFPLRPRSDLQDNRQLFQDGRRKVAAIVDERLAEQSVGTSERTTNQAGA